MKKLSEKIDSEYCLKCEVCKGIFSTEYLVSFPCYDNFGNLSIEKLLVHEKHVDSGKKLVRADLIEIYNPNPEIKQTHAEITLVENGHIHHKLKVPIEILVKNSINKSPNS